MFEDETRATAPSPRATATALRSMGGILEGKPGRAIAARRSAPGRWGRLYPVGTGVARIRMKSCGGCLDRVGLTRSAAPAAGGTRIAPLLKWSPDLPVEDAP